MVQPQVSLSGPSSSAWSGLQGLMNAPDRFLRSGAARYGAVAGSAVGLIGGIAYRTWQQVPADFKVLNRLDAVPFQFSAFNSVNGAMQTMTKGPMKYMMPALPLLSIGVVIASRTWQGRLEKITRFNGSHRTGLHNTAEFRHIGLWASFKVQVKHLPKGELIQATTVVALAALMAVTQTHWLPAVTQLLPVGADPSGHALMQIALGWSQALCIQATRQADCGRNTTRLWNLESVGLGVANAIFMFNTATTFHTVREVVSGSMLALSAVWVSAGCPRLFEVTNLAKGTTMIATSLGYAPAALSTMVMTPLSLAWATRLPRQMQWAKAELTSPRGRNLSRVYYCTSVLATINLVSAGAVTALAAFPSPLTTSLSWINSVTTTMRVAPVATTIRGIFDVAHHISDRRWSTAIRLTGTIATLGAMTSPASATVGALWIASAGCNLIADHFVSQGR